MDKITTHTGRKMLKSVSPVYDNDGYVLSIFEANGTIMEEVSRIVESLKYEMYPQNATWTLRYWENMLSIKYEGKPSDSERVQRVLFELNKYFTITRYRLETIVNTFVEKKNAFIEEVDGEYAFNIVIPFGGDIGAGLRDAVEEVKPAHLLAIFEQVATVGAIIIIDDSYSYPVYYKTCGEFSGEKEFSQLDVGDIDVTDDTYDYAVEYPVSEKQFMQIDSDPITAMDDTYSFVKDYEVCGVMSTLDKNVTTTQSGAEVDGSIYNVGIHYPVCGEFRAEGE